MFTGKLASLEKYANLVRDLFKGEQLTGEAIKDAIKVVQSKDSGRDFDEAFKNLIKTFHIDARVFKLISLYKAKGNEYDPIHDLNAVKSWVFETFFGILKKVNTDDDIGKIINFVNLRSNEFAYNKLLEALGKNIGIKTIEGEKTWINNSLTEFIKTYKREPDIYTSEEDAATLGAMIEKRKGKDPKKDLTDQETLIKHIEEFMPAKAKSLSSPGKFMQTEGPEDEEFPLETKLHGGKEEWTPGAEKADVDRKIKVMNRIVEHLKEFDTDKEKQVAYMTLFRPYFKEIRELIKTNKNKDLINAWRSNFYSLVEMKIPTKALNFELPLKSRQSMADILGMSERALNYQTLKVMDKLKQDIQLLRLLKEDTQASKSGDMKKYAEFLNNITKKYANKSKLLEGIVKEFIYASKRNR